MKLLIILMAFFMPLQSMAADNFLEEVRSLYVLAAQEEKSCEALIKSLESFNENNHPLYAGYKAAATMLMAKYVFSPFSKLNNFKKGKTLLEKAIDKDQKNTELRFIRYTIQLNAPAFLNYKNAINTDKVFLLDNYATIKDTQLKNNISSFFKNDNSLTTQEKKQIGL